MSRLDLQLPYSLKQPDPVLRVAIKLGMKTCDVGWGGHAVASAELWNQP